MLLIHFMSPSRTMNEIGVTSTSNKQRLAPPELDPGLVSIITPAYRAATFIGATIKSVQAQDYRNWELLVVDDCSPDDTCKVVSEFCADDNRVRLIRQSENSGPARARNAALAVGRGRYVAFLDSDDIWRPGKLSAQLQFMTEQNSTLCYSEFRRISEDGSRLGRRITVPEHLGYKSLLCNTAIVTSTVIVDRAKTGAIFMPDAPYDDFALWLLLLRSGHIACGLKKDLVRYRVVGDSVSRKKHVSAHRVWKTYREVENLGLVRSIWCFCNYAIRGWLKYRVF